MSQFVYVKKDINDQGIRKNEIGIMEETSGENVIVNFVCNNITLELSAALVEHFDPTKTGDQYQKKVCNICNRLLEVDMFEINQNAKNNRQVRRPSCKSCRAVINGMGMTSKEKRQMNKIKPHMIIWTCPICKKTTVPGLTSKVVCDHDHKTGHPRAWICDSCNTGLGRFKDDITLLSNAIKYLEDYED